MQSAGGERRRQQAENWEELRDEFYAMQDWLRGNPDYPNGGGVIGRLRADHRKLDEGLNARIDERIEKHSRKLWGGAGAKVLSAVMSVIVIVVAAWLAIRFGLAPGSTGVGK